jgi:uncharacterized protein (TIGR02265 family)
MADYPMRALMFESLFLHSLQLHTKDGPLYEDLKELGFDARKLEPSYPLSVLNACVDHAARALHPELSAERGRWEMGRLTVRGMLDTMVGKVLAVGINLLGPARYLKKYPDYMKMETVPYTCRVVQLEERAYRMEFEKVPEITPHFTAGMIEEGVRYTKVDPTLALVEHSPTRYDLTVRW